jgi:hypothetical protein
MQFNRVGKQLTIERGKTDATNLLDRLLGELREALKEFGDSCFTVITSGKKGPLRRDYVRLIFRSQMVAYAAEGWIENDFEVD